MVAIDIKVVINVAKNLNLLPALKAGIKAATLYVKGKISPYPPATAANAQHYPGTWYERGYGPRWMRKDGSIHGRKTSETLGRKWATRTQDDGLTGIVGNKASYGPYVQDRDFQARFHGARGWKTVQDVAEAEAESVRQIIRDSIMSAITRS